MVQVIKKENKMDNNTLKVMFSSKSDEYETPLAFYKKLDKNHNFTLDPCATDLNHKCVKYYTMQQDGLNQSWSGESVFINPPYSQISRWVDKAIDELPKTQRIVFLIPARTDTKYFEKLSSYAYRTLFVKRRLKFGGMSTPAPFPSAVIVLKPNTNPTFSFSMISNK